MEKTTPERRLTKFLILFDNSNLLYFPGQFLAGRVIVELHDEMAISGSQIVLGSRRFHGSSANDEYFKIFLLIIPRN